MKTYLVGGAVRDKLLGIEPKEKDWVVVESNQQELLNLGYKQVGKKFPVFLHPETFEEYALARIERKTEVGHKGFKFDTSKSVTLKQDLLRRDLTINAIAEDHKGILIDPYNGINDLENRLLRHVSDAFSEDPLRVFRVARFYATLNKYNFKIHKTTFEAMKEIVNSGEIELLSRERLWVELSKSFDTKNSWMFFEALILSNVAAKYFPEIINNDLLKRKIMHFSKIDIDKDIFLSIAGFSLNFIDLFGFPKKITDLYFIFNEFSAKFLSLKLDAKDILYFLNALDAFRRPERLKIFLTQVKYFIDFHEMRENNKLDIFNRLHKSLVNKIDYGDLKNKDIKDIKKKIEDINLSVITLVLREKSQ